MDPSNPSLVKALELADEIAASWWLVLLGLALGAFGGAMGLRVLPKTYEASTTIFVAPSRLPLDFGRSQAADDIGMRVASLKESVLSRPYLIKVAEDIYRTANSEATYERRLDSIRANLEASVIRFDPQRGSGVFQLSYRDTDPLRSARAVNLLAGLFIDENVKLRTSQAEDITTVLESLTKDARTKVDEREQAMTSFRSQHLYDLGDQKDANLRMFESRQRDLENNERLLAQEQDRRDLLLAQKATAQSAPAPSAPTVGETSQSRLKRLRSELDALRVRFTDAHPLVRAKQREINEFMATLPPETAQPDGGLEAAPATDPLDVQITASEREIERLKHDRERVRSELQLYQRRIENTPKVEQELTELTKGYDIDLARYKDLQTKLENARGAARVEAARQGEQFQVIEKAIPPLFPIKPSPLMIFAAAIGAGELLCVGPLVGRALISPRIRSRRGLRLSAAVPILATIGRLATPTTHRLTWRRRIWGVLVVAASVALLGAAFVALHG